MPPQRHALTLIHYYVAYVTRGLLRDYAICALRAYARDERVNIIGDER